MLYQTFIRSTALTTCHKIEEMQNLANSFWNKDHKKDELPRVSIMAPFCLFHWDTMNSEVGVGLGLEGSSWGGPDKRLVGPGPLTYHGMCQWPLK